MKKVTKAVIPCGGMGTRFLPITKSVPKEILPVIDTPVLGHIVNEAKKSGITDVLIVLGNGKDAIKNYFTPDPGLEKLLSRDPKKKPYLDAVKEISSGLNITYAVQKEPKGSGDAVLYAKEFVGGDPFILSWGDDLIYSDKPVMGQLISAYEKLGSSIIGVQHCDGDEITMYGVADVKKGIETGVERAFEIGGIVEKPPLDKLPSRLASYGRYLLAPDIFDVLEHTENASNGELQLTDALNSLARTSKMYAFDFTGKRYDMGDKFGSVEAIIEYALRSCEYGEKTKRLIKKLADTL